MTIHRTNKTAMEFICNNERTIIYVKCICICLKTNKYWDFIYSEYIQLNVMFRMSQYFER